MKAKQYRALHYMCLELAVRTPYNDAKMNLRNIKQEAHLPLRNRASAMYFFVAKLLSIAVMRLQLRLITSEAYVR